MEDLKLEDLNIYLDLDCEITIGEDTCNSEGIPSGETISEEVIKTMFENNENNENTYKSSGYELEKEEEIDEEDGYTFDIKSAAISVSEEYKRILKDYKDGRGPDNRKYKYKLNGEKYKGKIREKFPYIGKTSEPYSIKKIIYGSSGNLIINSESDIETAFNTIYNNLSSNNNIIALFDEIVSDRIELNKAINKWIDLPLTATTGADGTTTTSKPDEYTKYISNYVDSFKDDYNFFIKNLFLVFYFMFEIYYVQCKDEDGNVIIKPQHGVEYNYDYKARLDYMSFLGLIPCKEMQKQSSNPLGLLKGRIHENKDDMVYYYVETDIRNIIDLFKKALDEIDIGSEASTPPAEKLPENIENPLTEDDINNINNTFATILFYTEKELYYMANEVEERKFLMKEYNMLSDEEIEQLEKDESEKQEQITNNIINKIKAEISENLGTPSDNTIILYNEETSAVAEVLDLLKEQIQEGSSNIEGIVDDLTADEVKEENIKKQINKWCIGLRKALYTVNKSIKFDYSSILYSTLTSAVVSSYFLLGILSLSVYFGGNVIIGIGSGIVHFSIKYLPTMIKQIANTHQPTRGDNTLKQVNGMSKAITGLFDDGSVYELILGLKMGFPSPYPYVSVGIKDEILSSKVMKPTIYTALLVCYELMQHAGEISQKLKTDLYQRTIDAVIKAKDGDDYFAAWTSGGIKFNLLTSILKSKDGASRGTGLILPIGP